MNEALKKQKEQEEKLALEKLQREKERDARDRARIKVRAAPRCLPPPASRPPPFTPKPRRRPLGTPSFTSPSLGEPHRDAWAPLTPSVSFDPCVCVCVRARARVWLL
jgi:hypothetical protein